MTALLDRAHLELALALAGFQAGDRFELLRVEGGGARGHFSTDPAAAAQACGRNLTDLYLTMNPLKHEARPPKGRARAEDLAQVRCLNVDLDPHGLGEAERAAGLRLAELVREVLERELGVRPALIDSGRGHQLWLVHEAVPVALAGEVRKVLLAALAHRFRAHQGAHVDLQPWGPTYAGRLPGTINGKTGAPVRIVDEGNGRVVAWTHLATVVAEWQKTLPPPREGAQRVTPELQAVIDELEGHRPDSWTWLGAAAGRAGVHDVVREHVPRREWPAFDEGASDPRRRWPRAGIDEAFCERARRAMAGVLRRDERASKLARAQGDVEIVSITRHTEGRGRGGRIDLELRVRDHSFDLRGLDGRSVRSYSSICARAQEEGAHLPDLGPKGKKFWEEALERAWEKAKVELVEDGTTFAAAIEAVRTFFASRKEGDSLGSMRGGQWVRVEGGIAVDWRCVTDDLLRTLAYDGITRAQVAEVARALGASSSQPTLPDGKRVRCWVFPESILTEA